MKSLYFLILSHFCLLFCTLFASEFTVSSYNCGGLSHHYDYLRAATMQKLMQERYSTEPELMSLNEKIQILALKILFTTNANERALSQQEWDAKEYQHWFEHIAAAPTEANSPNTAWNQKVNELISSYKVRPVVIYDEEVNQLLQDHLKLSDASNSTAASLQKTRTEMAKRIFASQLKFDIICLQEADYLETSMFPEHLNVLLSETRASKNGVAWNKERFDLIETIGNIVGRAFAVKLFDKQTNQSIVVVSGHISGCNPYRTELDPATGVSDSAKGDHELRTVMQLLSTLDADFKIIGMDSNVTALHPRLNILKDKGYVMDYENFLESSCTNPYQVLNTRIDWIAMQARDPSEASIVNIPVLNVGLNSMHTNISDHKPVAAKIKF